MIAFPRALVAVVMMAVPTMFIAIVPVVLVPIVSAITFVDPDPAKSFDSIIPFVEPIVLAIVPEVHRPKAAMVPVSIRIAAGSVIALHNDYAWRGATVRIIAAVVITMRI